MNSFTISQVSRFAGIKPHTIRIWEQRYNSLRPERSEGNTRYYSSAQLRRLLNMVSLVQKGHKISELSPLPDEKIFELVKASGAIAPEDGPSEYYILQLIAAAVNYDEVHFEKILSHCLLRYGMKNAYINIFYPMLVRIGMMWTSNSLPPSQEHFISNLLKQKLYTAIDGLPPARSSNNTWLLLMPENEFHEIGLLLASYLIRLTGRKVIYLGPNVPLDSLSTCIKETKAKNVLVFIVNTALAEETSSYLKNLKKQIQPDNIYIASNESLIKEVNLPKAVQWLSSIDALEEKLYSENDV